MSITAKELAKHLNLSTASVSVALNNKPGVSTSTRKKVLTAARELGYEFSSSTKDGKLLTAEPEGLLVGNVLSAYDDSKSASDEAVKLGITR